MPYIKFNFKMIHQKIESVNLKQMSGKIFKSNNYGEKMENMEKIKRHRRKSLRSITHEGKVEEEESEESTSIFEEIMATMLLKLVKDLNPAHSRSSVNLIEDISLSNHT